MPRVGTLGPVHGFSYLIERKCTNGDWKSGVAACNLRREPHVFTLALQGSEDE